MARSRTRIAASAAVLFSCLTADSREVLGAEAILKRISEEQDTSHLSATPLGIVKKQFAAHLAASTALPPDKAAADWLAILENYLALPPAERSENYDTPDRISLTEIFSALPPPAAWETLTAFLDARHSGKKSLASTSRSILAAVLSSDPDKQLQALERLTESIDTAPLPAEYVRMTLRTRILPSLEENILRQTGANADPAATFARQLADFEKATGSYHSYITVPTLVGHPSAEELLLRAIKSGISINFTDPETERLAARIARENVSILEKPPWYLVNRVEDLPLFDALIEKFPKPDEHQLAARETVEVLRFQHLIAEGKTDEATALLDDPKRAALIASRYEISHESAPDPNLPGFLLTVLRKDPNVPFWDVAARTHSTAGKSEQFDSHVAEALLDPRLTDPKIRTRLEDLHLTNLLESDRVEEGLKYLGDLIGKATADAAKLTASSGGPDTTPPEEESLPVEAGLSAVSNPLQRVAALLTQSIRLGQLLDRPEMTTAGLDQLVTTLNLPSRNPPSEETFQLLLSGGRAADAEQIIATHLGRFSADSSTSQHTLLSYLESLALVYEHAGRPQDVIRLLDEAPFWPAGDLSLLHSYHSDDSIQLLAARAFAATGDTGKALAITHWIIRDKPGLDAAYEILVKLDPPDLIPFLDTISATHRFEERPLIWKAHILQQRGNLEEAEALVRKAISIDPSDGEQGKGNRMRAYSVLADILEKKGDTEQTKFFREVIAAIRLSEQADDWWTAGLNRSAIRIYKQSLERFSDAYCIQSRLALRYASIGDKENARIHYQRAFELMPDSFGRIESHCFGCEGAFSQIDAQNIAEEVFTSLAAKPGAKAQVFYLLGYLRNTQHRPEEAAGFFRKAVELDPDYINTWHKLRELAENSAFSTAQRDEIHFAIYRLTGNLSVLSDTSDIRQLWETLLAAEKATPPEPPSDLHPLRASVERLKTSPPRDYYLHSRTRERPRGIFPRQALVRNVIELLETTAQ